MNSNSNNYREMFWDESNRLRVVYDQNSYQMQHYIYDAAGERTLKASSKIENVYENGQLESNNTTMGLYTTYVSPYMVVDANQKYSKHYFNGTQRVASKIGEQDIAIFENGNQYLKQANSKAAENTPSTDFDALKNKQITDFSYYLSKSTNNATAKNLKVNYTEYKKVDTNTETTSAKAADNNSAFAAQQYAEIYYYHSDHLGTGTFLSDFDGNPYQFFLNLPFGETMAEQHSYSGEYTNRYKFNGKELDEETGFYYYGARYYNPKFSIWLSVDPLAHMRVEWSPYNFCRNNPINNTDPTGALDAPIYDENANFLGTDDEGLQGKAIVMNKDNFKQGMSHEDAMSKSLGVEGLKGEGSTTKLLDHYNGLKSRPDYDGYLTLDEANKWYREGNGQPLFTSLAKIDLSGILSLGENYVGEKGSYNLLLNSNSVNDGLVYGSITLKRYPNHQVRAYADEYNFEMHNPWNPLNWPRNGETLIGRKYAGEGQKFDINIYGSKKLTPILPWIK